MSASSTDPPNMEINSTSKNDETSCMLVRVTLALNTNRKQRKLVMVQPQADCAKLLILARKKLRLKGHHNCEIFLSRTGELLRDGDLLENGDELLVTKGEACTVVRRSQQDAAKTHVEEDQKLTLPVATDEPQPWQPLQPSRYKLLPERKTTLGTTPDYLCILDFEATTSSRHEKAGNQTLLVPAEIIEFPCLLLNVTTANVEKKFHRFVRPNIHPILTTYCMDKTHIKQKWVDHGVSLSEAIRLHEEWLDGAGLVPLGCTALDDSIGSNDTGDEEAFVAPRKTFLYLTCGDWDIGTLLAGQLSYHGEAVPPNFFDWINIKVSFQTVRGLKTNGMTDMLKAYGLKLEGQHHRGIDDCRNIARLCQVMLHEGWKPTQTSSLTDEKLERENDF